MKRLALVAATISALMLGAGTASAAGGDTTSVSSPVSFVLTSAMCANLPAGTSISGTGMQTSITTIRWRNGVTIVKNSTHSQGTATDEANNDYRWGYNNSFLASNTVADPALLSGFMVDAFHLTGSGPMNLHNGFLSTFTSNFAFTTFSADPGISWGDPIAFAPAPFAHHCDPL